MWQAKITIVHVHNMNESKVRHKVDLKKADLIVLYAGEKHFSPIGKYGQ